MYMLVCLLALASASRVPNDCYVLFPHLPVIFPRVSMRRNYTRLLRAGTRCSYVASQPAHWRQDDSSGIPGP
jgi:hypothetical protein